MDYWKIVALVGTIIFLVSGFLPMISASEFSFSLFNLYAVMGQAGENAGSEHWRTSPRPTLFHWQVSESTWESQALLSWL